MCMGLSIPQSLTLRDLLPRVPSDGRLRSSREIAYRDSYMQEFPVLENSDSLMNRTPTLLHTLGLKPGATSRNLTANG
jgi:hypothetical protein